MDPERERISLGIKQLADDTLSNFIANHPKGSIVSGKIKEIEAKKAIIELAEGVEGQLKSSDYSKEKIEDLHHHLSIGDEIELKFMGIERKTRSLILSARIKEKDSGGDSETEYKPQEAPTSTTLGDLLKEKLESDKS